MSDPDPDGAEVRGRDAGLPLLLNATPASTPPAPPRRRSRRRWLLGPMGIALVFLGGVIGLYFQPPGLKLFFHATGLAPGGGTSSPIATAATPPPAPAPGPARVIALGRLSPAGDVRTVAPPFGANDARIAEMLVAEGDRVAAGRILAVLDNAGSLHSALAGAEADAAVTAATLERTRDTVRANLAEAEATLRSAEAAAENATAQLDRARSLLARGAATQAAFDVAEAVARQTAREVERARAARSRYAAAEGIDGQVDVVVAARGLDAAQAALAEARSNLEKANVRAPIDGAIIEIHVKAGEKPGAAGILDIGDIDHMTAELEVAQDSIGRIALGDAVEIRADALGPPLHGVVTGIGLSVGRQTLTRDDPAANTDARVVKVVARLDAVSAPVAARFTNLQVIGRIDVGGAR